jgi:lipopolysaccharide biosynthesis regulator YciM
MISELLISNDESSKAMEQFQEILSKKPDNFGILAKFITLHRRNGTLDAA